eukprot:scaffold317_cov260-Pinguiococcus_pyrenoidosus.AAC.9
MTRARPPSDESRASQRTTPSRRRWIRERPRPPGSPEGAFDALDAGCERVVRIIPACRNDPYRLCISPHPFHRSLSTPQIKLDDVKNANPEATGPPLSREPLSAGKLDPRPKADALGTVLQQSKCRRDPDPPSAHALLVHKLRVQAEGPIADGNKQSAEKGADGDHERDFEERGGDGRGRRVVLRGGRQLRRGGEEPQVVDAGFSEVLELLAVGAVLPGRHQCNKRDECKHGDHRGDKERKPPLPPQRNPHAFGHELQVSSAAEEDAGGDRSQPPDQAPLHGDRHQRRRTEHVEHDADGHVQDPKRLPHVRPDESPQSPVRCERIRSSHGRLRQQWQPLFGLHFSRG